MKGRGFSCVCQEEQQEGANRTSLLSLEILPCHYWFFTLENPPPKTGESSIAGRSNVAPVTFMLVWSFLHVVAFWGQQHQSAACIC